MNCRVRVSVAWFLPTVRPRPVSATRRFPSPSFQKENSNPRRSTCSSNPPKTLSRRRSSSPSLDRAHKPIPASQKPKPSSTKSKISQNTSTTVRTSTELNKNSQDANVGKYSSRLHEKLAFLEGKVKRIASDIKKTKEMLDLNNPDASKVILSDIQDKISGIEKAMVHVVSTNDGVQGQGEDDKVKGFGKGLKLNSEELESRLFPHQKLLRDRTLGKDKDKDSVVLSPVDDNSVAVEFLALIDKEVGKGNAGEQVKEKGGRNGGWSDHKCDIDNMLTADEKLEEFDDDDEEEENKEGASIKEDMDEAFNFRLNEIGSKVASGGWFVSEGEAVVLAHQDGSCTYYDIANCETVNWSHYSFPSALDT